MVLLPLISAGGNALVRLEIPGQTVNQHSDTADVGDEEAGMALTTSQPVLHDEERISRREIWFWRGRQKLREVLLILTGFSFATVIALTIDLAATQRDMEHYESGTEENVANAHRHRHLGAAVLLTATSFIGLQVVARSLAVSPRSHQETLRLLGMETATSRGSLLRVKGWLLRGVGTAVIVVGSAFGLAGLPVALKAIPQADSLSVVEKLGAGVGAAIAGALVFSLLARCGVRMWVTGKRYIADSATDELLRDPRPPVLYLRSFEHDFTTAAGLPSSQGFARMFTEEEQLAMAMRKIGPFIAIGAPGEELPHLGAARTYVDHENWQHVVRELMARARLVVLRAGDTPGFWWELSQAAKTVPPERLLFLIPMDRDGYERFCVQANSQLPVPLPPYEGTFNDTVSVQAAVYFKRDWTPEFLHFDWDAMRTTSPRTVYSRLVLVLRPFFRHLGVRRAHPLGLRDIGRLLAYAYALWWVLIVGSGVLTLLDVY